jgi:iron complex transport system substrate-binding protein
MTKMKPETKRKRFRFAGLLIALTSASLAGSMSANATVKKKAAKKPTAVKSFPVTVKNGDGSITLTKQPIRIVSLSPSATEMIFAIGAGAQVKAVDDQSNYPASIPKTALSGFKPNVEAISAYKPDLVIMQDEVDATKALRALKIPVLILPAAKKLADSYVQIEQLGAVTGHVATAVQVSSGMQAEIKKIVDGLPKRTSPIRYYHELDSGLFTATSKTFIGEIYTLLGMTNVADPADKDASGYPQLSAEYLVKANPDVVLLANTKCCGETAAKFGARPGFAAMSAVKAGQIVELDDDIASRWGPRVVDLVKLLAEKTKALQGTPAPVG